MSTIFKYPLDLPFTEVHVPADAKVLSVGVQHNAPVVWIQLSRGAPEDKELHFAVTGTGHDVPDGRYVSSFQIEDTNGTEFVGHVYVRGE